MFPIILNSTNISVMVIGNGPATERRLKLLEAAGTKNLYIYRNKFPEDKDYDGIQVMMIGDLDHKTSMRLAKIARKKGILVNVEDHKPGCDYYVPAIVRRGDLLLTVSTGGGSPRLARRIRQLLEKLFTKDWEAWLKQIASARQGWRKQKLSFDEVVNRTDEMIEKEGWLKIFVGRV